MKKTLIILLSSILILSSFAHITQAETNTKEVTIFTSPTCPHCTHAKSFLNDLKEEKIPELTINNYEISKNIELLNTFYETYAVPKNKQGFVPAIFIDDLYYIGFSDQIGQEITDYLSDQEQEDPNQPNQRDKQEEVSNELITLPLLGTIDPLEFSFPLLAVTLGMVDGFNVCSLGALVLILSLVLVLRSRRKIFILGSAFILTTAIVYGFLIFLWHQFFSVIAPYIRGMEILIGILALLGGIYLLREFYKAYKVGPICSSNNLMNRLTPKIEGILKNKTNWFILTGAVALFATIVTVVEFPCSAFLPALFTSILVDAGVPLGTAIFYIGIYMTVYLLDEVIIFIIATLTLKIKIVSPKFIIFFNLLAALIFIFLGVYYLFGWLS